MNDAELRLSRVPVAHVDWDRCLSLQPVSCIKKVSCYNEAASERFIMRSNKFERKLIKNLSTQPFFKTSSCFKQHTPFIGGSPKKKKKIDPDSGTTTVVVPVRTRALLS